LAAKRWSGWTNWPFFIANRVPDWRWEV
jgi:hypothetical protein